MAKDRGVEYYDFVGSDIPRLAEFKKSFGGERITHSLIEKTSSKRIRFLRNQYPVYRKTIGNIRKKLHLVKD